MPGHARDERTEGSSVRLLSGLQVAPRSAYPCSKAFKFRATKAMIDGYWLPVQDGDRRVFALLQRHYSFRRYRGVRPRACFVGVGEKMVLLTVTCDAAFIWRRSASHLEFGWQDGVACSMFRNEGPIRSSDLIREACALAWQKWPGQRLFTYVADAKIRSINPGACFKKAGWRTCGRNADGRLTILERLP